MPRKPIPEELLSEKQKRDRILREKHKKYYAKYSKFYYLKKQLENPDYNKENYQRQTELKKLSKIKTK